MATWWRSPDVPGAAPVPLSRSLQKGVAEPGPPGSPRASTVRSRARSPVFLVAWAGVCATRCMTGQHHAGSLRLTGSQHGRPSPQLPGPCPGPLAVVRRLPQLQRPPFLREAASPRLSCGGSALLPPPSPAPWLAGYLLAPPQSSRASLWLLLRGPLARGRSHVLRECCRRVSE